LKLWVFSSASQTAQAIIVDSGVNLLLPFNQRKHFVNHSSALHARKALEFTDLPVVACPAVKPEATTKRVLAQKTSAESKTGTDVQFTAPAGI
jgi:hypothetical protein